MNGLSQTFREQLPAVLSADLPAVLPPGLSRLLRRGQRAFDEGDFRRAERLYGEVLAHQPNNFDALHGLGLINLRHGRPDAALAFIQSALRSDLSRADGFASLGLVFHALRQFERALVSYDEGLRFAPNDPELHSRRGVALLEMGRPPEALASFDRALQGDPDHFDALGNRGNALLKLNRVAEALAAYDRAIARACGCFEKDPDSHQPRGGSPPSRSSGRSG